jgi:hypothetical protein
MTTHRMTRSQLREAMFHAAGTAVVSFILGCGYDDILLDDDGFRWPTRISRVELSGWKRAPENALEIVATIYEAGTMAANKARGLGPHRIWGIAYEGELTETAWILDDPKVWAAIEEFAAYLEENDEEHGCYGAMAMHDDEDAAIKLLKDRGLYPGYSWRRPNDAKPRPKLIVIK